MRELVVNKKYHGKKLNTFLLDSFNGLSMNSIYKALRKKDIRVNNIKVKDNVVLNENDVINIYISDEFLFKKIDFNIVFEDDNILVVNKPENIEVIGSCADTTLTSLLQENYSYIKPCHRIDRNTKGLVLFAKTEEVLNILLEKFKNREIDKFYKCTVYGIPKKKSDILNSYLFKDTKKSLVYISDVPKKGYDKIITSYKVLETNKENNTSILEVKLHTGRTHQIRAHLAHIGYPIIGDGKYGNNEINKKFKKKTQELFAYKIIFNFTDDARILNYLKGKEICVK